MFLYKLVDKRDAFSFLIVRMPYIDSIIPKSIFYSQSLRWRKALCKIIRRYEKSFVNFGKNYDEILSELHISNRKVTLNNYVINNYVGVFFVCLFVFLLFLAFVFVFVLFLFFVFLFFLFCFSFKFLMVFL